MNNRKYIATFALLLMTFVCMGQAKDSVQVKKKKAKRSLVKSNRANNPLAPSKASFYSAVLPGLGQIYNGKYWKAPIVWGSLAVPVYFYLDNNSQYKRFRTAYKQRLAGLQDEFTLDNGVVIASLETLESAQEQLRQNRDLSILSGVIVYILQIVEASINAHMLQFNTDDTLTVQPTIIQDQFTLDTPTVGLRIRYTF